MPSPAGRTGPPTCARAAGWWRWNGTTRATAAPAWPWRSSRRPAPCWPGPPPTRASGTSARVCADLRSWTPGPDEAGRYDLAACNPPYFAAGPRSPDPARAAARHEGLCTLEDVCACAFRLLRDGGRLTLCHRPERLAEVLATLREHRLEPKRLAFVRSRAGAAPWLFLVEGQKNRRTGLRLEPDILVAAGAAQYGPDPRA